MKKNGHAEAAMKAALDSLNDKLMVELIRKTANRKPNCMPGQMVGVGACVENVRDDLPDLVTYDAVGGRDNKEQLENSRRIAACWNALRMFSTEEIESQQFFTMNLLDEVRVERRYF